MSIPHAHGHLPVTDGNTLYWEEHGTPHGTPCLVLHGGPGSGSHPGLVRFFDPARHRVLLFDQRGAGRSTPDAAHPDTDLTTNTTAHLIDDIEALRVARGIDTWLVLGLSWGSTLGLAYTQAHPDRVRALVLAAVTTTSPTEVHWLTHDMGRVFPERWETFRDAAGPGADPHRLPAAYARLLADPDPTVREEAARAWCRWEDTHMATTTDFTPFLSIRPVDFQLRFARLVTHYWAHHAFLPPGHLLTNTHRMAHVPGAMIHGRLDISGPADTAHHLSRRWPAATLTIVEGAGHTKGLHESAVRAIDRLTR
ncbi:prolyl aminopeptidase [Nocardiopsis lambiniae]|uniref:Proline iminopeptidase n=1 Tax=Nocardiopsis lambiniae TaxID=3075539 RepID=A0ABU2MHT7_9ACTN|nr:prolyl aminopeptidase [Nocardiopsis sp. DSM 44743]MDT0332095.1 prolyl aminopeptidase [Nocardiopsis sp. DSM 44743]